MSVGLLRELRTSGNLDWDSMGLGRFAREAFVSSRIPNDAVAGCLFFLVRCLIPLAGVGKILSLVCWSWGFVGDFRIISTRSHDYILPEAAFQFVLLVSDWYRSFAASNLAARSIFIGVASRIDSWCLGNSLRCASRHEIIEGNLSVLTHRSEPYSCKH